MRRLRAQARLQFTLPTWPEEPSVRKVIFHNVEHLANKFRCTFADTTFGAADLDRRSTALRRNPWPQQHRVQLYGDRVL